MNPLILFDYVYYSIAYLYANKFGYKESKEFAGIGILCMLQLFNGLALFGLIYKPLTEFEELSPLFIFIGGYASILILNIIRYKKITSYKELSVKWENDNKKTRLVKVLYVVVYMLLTLLLLGV